MSGKPADVSSLVNSETDSANAPIHLHSAVIEPDLFDVRTHLPMNQLAAWPGVSLSTSEQKVVMPAIFPGVAKVAVIQRFSIDDVPLWKADMARIMKKGWVVVTEFDDHPGLIAKVQRTESTDAMWEPIRLVHAVQTSTPRLADVFRHYNPNVAVFPNCAFSLAPSPLSVKPGQMRVFFAALNREAFSRRVGAALAPFAQAHPGVEFVVVHDRAFFDALGNANKTFHSLLPYAQYIDLLGSCDVSLMPLEGADGEEFKSDLKFIEASSRGVVSVASPTVYGDTIVDGVTGMIAADIGDWAPALKRLCDDYPFRFHMGQAALAYVDRERRFHWQAPQRLAWYRQLSRDREALNQRLQNLLA